MTSPRYSANTVTLSDPTTVDGARTWDVYLGSAVIGRIYRPERGGAYTATVGEFTIDDSYSVITLAAAAVQVAHQRAAAL